MPAEQLTQAQRELVNKFLGDAQARGVKHELSEARDLLVLALEVSGSNPDVLARSGDIREFLNSVPKKEEPKNAQGIKIKTQPNIVPITRIVPEALPAIEIGKNAVTWKGNNSYGGTTENEDPDDDQLASLEDTTPLTRSIPSPYLNQGSLSLAARINRKKGDRILDSTDVLLEEYKAKKQKSSPWRIIFLFLLAAAGGGGWWYMQPVQVKKRDLENSVSQAQLALSQNRNQEAIKWAEAALAIEPTQFEMRVVLIEAYLKDQNTEEASRVLKEAGKISDSWQEDMALGRLWGRAGNPAESAEAFFNAFSKGGTEVTADAKEIIEAQQAIGQIERAERISQMLLPAQKAP